MASLQIEIPEAESTDEKEVFAFFGLATYAAQVLEAELINLCVALEASRKKQPSREKVEALFLSYENRTFGTLLRTLRNDSRVPADLIARYRIAAIARNRLAHNFFRDHSENFLSDAGRAEMIEDLRGIVIGLRSIDADSEAITHAIWSQLGITEDFILREMQALQERARLRDAAT